MWLVWECWKCKQYKAYHPHDLCENCLEFEEQMAEDAKLDRDRDETD